MIDYIKKHEQSAFRNQKDMIAMADGLLSYHQNKKYHQFKKKIHLKV